MHSKFPKKFEGVSLKCQNKYRSNIKDRLASKAHQQPVAGIRKKIIPPIPP
jgi:hypothetical protein